MTILGLVADHPWVGGLPSLGWCATILRIVGDHPLQLSPGVSFASKVLVPNYKSVVHCILVGDHHRIAGRPSLGWLATILRMVGAHPWQLSPAVSFVSNVQVPI